LVCLALSVLGRHDEAIAELRKAENLDPLSLIISADVAEELLIAHQYDESIQQSRKAVVMDSNFAVAHYELGQAYVQKHMHNEGIAELQKAIVLSGDSTTCTSNLAYAYAVSGQKREASKILNELTNRSAHLFSNAPEIALIYVGLGEKDQAMIWLERAYAERFNPGSSRGRHSILCALTRGFKTFCAASVCRQTERCRSASPQWTPSGSPVFCCECPEILAHNIVTPRLRRHGVISEPGSPRDIRFQQHSEIV
jgi:tetratricopeptide (TPR) repeat protein